jgi:hypothetical protein
MIGKTHPGRAFCIVVSRGKFRRKLPSDGGGTHILSQILPRLSARAVGSLQGGSPCRRRISERDIVSAQLRSISFIGKSGAMVKFFRVEG